MSPELVARIVCDPRFRAHALDRLVDGPPCGVSKNEIVGAELLRLDERGDCSAEDIRQGDDARLSRLGRPQERLAGFEIAVADLEAASLRHASAGRRQKQDDEGDPKMSGGEKLREPIRRRLLDGLALDLGRREPADWRVMLDASRSERRVQRRVEFPLDRGGRLVPVNVEGEPGDVVRPDVLDPERTEPLQDRAQEPLFAALLQIDEDAIGKRQRVRRPEGLAVEDFLAEPVAKYLRLL